VNYKFGLVRRIRPNFCFIISLNILGAKQSAYVALASSGRALTKQWPSFEWTAKTGEDSGETLAPGLSQLLDAETSSCVVVLLKVRCRSFQKRFFWSEFSKNVFNAGDYNQRSAQ
jgi:hypothetical protein